MPELPEVETIKNDLRQLVLGSRIVSARVLDPSLVAYPAVADFEAGLLLQGIEAVDRKAKYLLIRLSSGSYLVLQLMITGQFLLVPRSAPIRRSTRLVLDLHGDQQLRLLDSSRYARVHLLDPEQLNERLHLDLLGPEALADELTPEVFARLLRGRRRQIKALLLDQRVVSGLGNIYADEVLHEARLHPLRLGSSLTDEEIDRLYRAIRRILAESVISRGTTTQSYRDVLGRKGSYQSQLKVFRRAGQPCADCPGLVEEIRAAGRETFLCPSCQPLQRE